MVKRQSRWRSKCWFVPWEVGAWQATEWLNMEDILISWQTGKSMQCCFIRFKRCRTCRSQLRCWTCGRRGTFSISWGWRARSKGCGQSFDRSNRTGKRSSTKTFRYVFVWCLTLGEASQEEAVNGAPLKLPERHLNWKTFILGKINTGPPVPDQGQNYLKNKTGCEKQDSAWII